MPCALTNPRSVRRYAEFDGNSRRRPTGSTPASSPASPMPKICNRRRRQLRPSTSQGPCCKAQTGYRRSHRAEAAARQPRRQCRDAGQRRRGDRAAQAAIPRLEGEIASMIDDDPLWAQLAEAWRSVKGVAGRTIARLMADLPEIGTYSNKAIAKLAGLAPIADDSGKRNGKRSIRGGRASVRSILFLVASRRQVRQVPCGFPRKIARGRKTQNGRARCSGPQTARPSQRKSTRCACPIRQCNLDSQIVAHPNPLPIEVGYIRLRQI